MFGLVRSCRRLVLGCFLAGVISLSAGVLLASEDYCIAGPVNCGEFQVECACQGPGVCLTVNNEARCACSNWPLVVCSCSEGCVERVYDSN